MSFHFRGVTACVSPKFFGVIGTVFLKGVPECGFGGVIGILKTVKKLRFSIHLWVVSHYGPR